MSERNLEIKIISKKFGEIKIANTCFYNQSELLISAIEQLQQENKELRDRLEITQGHRENVQINELYERKEKEKYRNILNEFESWLEKYKKKLNTSDDFDRCARIIVIEVLDKLKKLKGEINEK